MRWNSHFSLNNSPCGSRTLIVLALLAAGANGCRTSGDATTQIAPEVRTSFAQAEPEVDPPRVRTSASPIRLAGHAEGQQADAVNDEVDGTSVGDFLDGSPGAAMAAFDLDDLQTLEAIAHERNPELRRLQQETAAAWAKVRYVDKLPDPTVGANVFGHPIETAAGSQRGNLSVMQMIPWLDRLDAQAQQACYEAMAMQQMYQAERLKVIGELRVNWAKLYVLGRQLETIEGNMELVESLSDLVTARIGQNRGSIGDVTLLTLELGRLEEQSLTTKQMIRSTEAEINRLARRPAETPIAIPESLPTELPMWSHEMLRQMAWERQPAIAAAQLRSNASRWGIEVAELRRRPDVSLGASWFFVDNNRPPSMVVDVGRDAWSVGAQVSVPLWTEKYDAMRDEATWKHFAATASVEDLQLKFDALLRDQWEQARAADEMATLYRSTIIPQARQTLEADQQALANGTVDLDRVIQDIRSLLTLELGYDRTIGNLSTSLARIRQAVGVDLSAGVTSTVEPMPMPTTAGKDE